jgi:hypothetical protein
LEDFAPTDETRVFLEVEPLWAFVLVLLVGLVLFAVRSRARRIGATVAPAASPGLRRIAKFAYLAVVVVLAAVGTLGAVLALLGPVRIN